ncbi:MAG: ribonuclease domain-containing protein [Lachnospiraceae bacterium]|nr:ribonuclease domain-containing protein [Lachnospiraceae bacterium]
MNNRIKKAAAWFLILLLTIMTLSGCVVNLAETGVPQNGISEQTAAVLDEHGSYSTKDEVALYLHTYGHLPDNYITKKEAEQLGWNSKKGNLTEVAPGKSIGGSHFGNYEGQLPEKEGRKYYECDLEYEGGYRGAERIIYSNDELVFYTGDHYKNFEQLY